MNILLCHTTLRSGGIESMIVNLANELSKSHKVTVCLIFEPKDDDVCLKKLSNGIKIISLGKTKRGVNIILLWKLLRIFSKEKYDAIQLNGFFFYYFLSILLLHPFRNFFYTVHNEANEENRSWDKKLFSLKKWCFKKNWMIPITISDNSHLSFKNLYGVDGNLIYNGVPNSLHIEDMCIDNYKKTPLTKILFNPARISEQKNQIMLCMAIKDLVEEGFDICLLIAGSNDNEKIFSELSVYFNERIRYIGEIDNALSFMKQSDAMCLSSIYEGMPVTVLEALSIGCIPICTPVGGIVNVIKNQYNGFLSEDVLLESYKTVLRKFLETSDDDIFNMKKNCIDSFSPFCIENTAKQYSLLFERYNV